MEYKWFCIMVSICGVALLSFAGVDRYTVNQCKVSYTSSNKTVEDILKICGE